MQSNMKMIMFWCLFCLFILFCS